MTGLGEGVVILVEHEAFRPSCATENERTFDHRGNHLSERRRGKKEETVRLLDYRALVSHSLYTLVASSSWDMDSRKYISNYCSEVRRACIIHNEQSGVSLLGLK